MKKILSFILLLSIIATLTACSAKLPYDLSNTSSIEIHAYGNDSADPIAKFIVNGEEVAILTQMFSSLKLNELKYTEPSIRGYQFWFRNENGDGIAKIELPYGPSPWVVVGGTAYQDVDGGIDVEYLAQLVEIASTAGPKSE